MSDLTLSNLSARIGMELGVSEWVTLDQSRIDDFASCTGDRQWIHIDVERAKRESPYGGPVAHGYLTLAMVAPLAMQIGVIPKDVAAGLNYGVDKARFPSAVPAGARVRLRVVLIDVEPKENGQAVMKTRNTLEIEGSDKPALIADTLAFLIPAARSRLPRAATARQGPVRPMRRPSRQRATRSRSIQSSVSGAAISSRAPASSSRR